MIGKNIFENIASKDLSGDTGKHGGGLFDKLKGWLEDGKDEVEHKIGDIIGEGAEKVTKELQVSDWYSLHVMGSCKGNFEPNATTGSAFINVTNCTDAALSGKFFDIRSRPMYPELLKWIYLARLNVTRALDHEVQIGPVKINPANFGVVTGIQSKVDKLNTVLLVLFIGHIITIVIIGIALLCSIRSSTTTQPGESVKLNALLAIVGGLLWTIGSVIVTVVFDSVVGEINKIGNKFGFFAEKGRKFYALIWTTAVCMVCVCIIWCKEWWQGRHRRSVRLQKENGGK